MDAMLVFSLFLTYVLLYFFCCFRAFFLYLCLSYFNLKWVFYKSYTLFKKKNHIRIESIYRNKSHLIRHKAYFALEMIKTGKWRRIYKGKEAFAKNMRRRRSCGSSNCSAIINIDWHMYMGRINVHNEYYIWIASK